MDVRRRCLGELAEACRLERVLKGIQQLPLLDARMPLGMQFGINAFRPKEVFPMCIPLSFSLQGAHERTRFAMWLRPPSDADTR